MITIQLSLEEYINHAQGHGRDFIICDTSRYNEIIKQDGWEKEVYLEAIELAEGIDKSQQIYRLWRLKDWNWTQQWRNDLKEEGRQVRMKEDRARHEALEKWKTEAREKLNKLVVLGKLTSSDVERWITKAMNPVTPFDSQLRGKLNYPQDI